VLDTTTEALPEIVYCLTLLKESVNLNDTDEMREVATAAMRQRGIVHVILPVPTMMERCCHFLLVHELKGSDKIKTDSQYACHFQYKRIGVGWASHDGRNILSDNTRGLRVMVSAFYEEDLETLHCPFTGERLVSAGEWSLLENGCKV